MGKEINEICLVYVNNKNERTFSVAMDRLQPGLFDYISKMEEDFDAVNSVLSTTFTKMWTEIDKYKEELGNFSTWMYRIARNEALQYKRYTSRNVSYEAMLETVGDEKINLSEKSYTMDENLEEKEKDLAVDVLHEIVIEKIENLDKENFKDALKLRIFEKKTYNEIAKILDINKNTAKARVFHGKKYLKKVITKEFKNEVADYLEKL